MLSNVTLSYGGQSISVPGLYLLIGILIILGLIGFIVAITSARRIERKTKEATDIVVVQLERIGDALDRLVTQNPATGLIPARPPNEPARAANRSLSEWVVPGRSTPAPSRVAPEGSALERAAKKPAISIEQHSESSSTGQSSTQVLAQDAPAQAEKSAGDLPVESTLSEPARTILFSMLNR